MIIGIHGRAQCGKDTLAQAMQRPVIVGAGVLGENEAPDPNVCILHFADALRDVVQAAFGSRYETAEEKAVVDQWWQERLSRPALTNSGLTYAAEATGRRILQYVGTEMFRNLVHQDFWLFALERRLSRSTAKHRVIPDVRFANEAQWIRDQKGIVIGLVRADHPPLPRGAHASEQPLPWELLDERHICDSADAVRTLGGVLARKYLI